MWAKHVAKLLLLAMIRVFPRHRWVHSFNDVRAYALLGINNVLQRGGLRWLAGKAPVPMAVVAKPPVPLQDVVSEAVVPWTFSDDEEKHESLKAGAAWQLVLPTPNGHRCLVHTAT